MKQHITPEDLNQLSESGKQKLREWYSIKVQKDIKANWESGFINPTNISIYEYLTIGRLILFLTENAMGDLDLKIVINSAGSSVWKCIGDLQDKNLAKLNTQEDGCDLCEALWSATKECLENKSHIHALRSKGVEVLNK